MSSTTILAKYIPNSVVVSGSLYGDASFLLIVFLIILGIAYYFGRGFIVSLIISFYPATILFKLFPFMDKAIFADGAKLLLLNKLGLFLLFLIPITIIVNRFMFSAGDYSGGENILRLAGLSLAFLVVLVLFSYNTVNYDVFHNYSSQIDSIFGASGREFYWVLAPIALLSIL
jgi:hypothetical protein